VEEKTYLGNKQKGGKNGEKRNKKI